VPSLRRPLLARTLGALLAALLAAPFVALAQPTDPSDRFFMRPQIDGDPRNPPRFSRDDLSIGQTAQPQTFTYQPGRGAGTTGFDSTNSRRQKDKRGQKAKAAKQGGSTAARSTAGQASTLPTSTTLTTTTPSTLTSATTPTYVPPATVTLRVGQPVPSATAAHFTQNQNENKNQAENQNLKQNQIANQTQQPRAAPVTNATYPVGPLVDLPRCRRADGWRPSKTGSRRSASRSALSCSGRRWK